MDGSRKYSGGHRPGGRKPIRRRKVAPDGTLVGNQPTAIGDVLSSMLKKTPLGRKIKLARIWDEWPQIAGPKLAPHGCPHSVRKNTLVVAVESNVWMHRFDYAKWEIVQRVNLLYKRELVSDLYIVLKEDEEEE